MGTHRSSRPGRGSRREGTESQLAEVSRHFLTLDADAIDAAVREHLAFAADLAGADRTFLAVLDPAAARVEGAYAWTRPGVPERDIPLDISLGERFPWARVRLEAGRVTQARSPGALPPEAPLERAMLESRGVRSMLLIPVRSGAHLFGGQLFETTREERVWSEEEIGRLRLLGDVFASAIERRRADQILRANEERFRAFAENAMELVAELDANGVYLYASPSHRDILGCDPEELIGKPGDVLSHPQDHDAAKQSFMDAIRGKSGTRIVARGRHADGSWRWIESMGRAYRADDGRMRYVSIGRDVTEGRAMVEAMERQLGIERQIADLSRRFLALGTQALDDAVKEAVEEAGALAGADRAYLYAAFEGGDQPFRCRFEWLAPGVPSAPARRWPWAFERLLGGDMLHFERLAEMPSGAREERESLERRGVKSLVVIPIHALGRFAGVIGFESMREERRWSDHDLTRLQLIGEILTTALERRRTEAALRESEAKLQQSQKLEAVGRLAGGIAHDFNNLLTVILGFSRPLLRELADDDPTREDVTEIHHAAERAATLTRQLLTFSRRQSVEEAAIDLNVVLEDLLPLVARLLGEDIEIALELASDLRAVRGDPHQFEQVMLNLAANARDAMPDGGTLRIHTANRELDEVEARRLRLAGPGEHVLVSVSDTGEGIDEETRARIFDPFFTTKDPGQGTGLGLSIVFSVVERAKGAIEVKAEPGKGATFEIWLPVAGSSARRAEPGRRAEAPGGDETVLLVEDADSVRRLTRGILERAGYRVLEASDGLRGLEVAQAHDGPIDLLLSDVVMPRLGGYELARRLGELRPGLRTLFVSGYPGEGNEADAPSSHPVLPKPFSEEALLDRIRDVLG